MVGYTIWAGAPGIYLVLLKRHCIEIYYSPLLITEQNIKATYGDISLISNKLHILQAECLLKESLDIAPLTQDILKEFQLWEKKKDKYKGNWMNYPQAQLDRQRNIITSKWEG